MKVAVIPARSGSKRIPQKNIKLFAGKPMIAYAIAAALDARIFDHVVVSTDDDNIAKLANEWGAKTPFSRPLRLADDHTPTVPVVAHAIESCESIGWDITAVCCIYPGVPFLKSEDVIQAWQLLDQSKADYVFPIAEFPSAVQRALKQKSNGFMAPLFPEFELTRTQDLNTAYHDAGQFYWGWRNSWLKQPNIHSHGQGFSIPTWRAIDIDTPDDWNRAEKLYCATEQK